MQRKKRSIHIFRYRVRMQFQTNSLISMLPTHSTREEGHIGHYAREIGETTYCHTAKAKNWMQREFNKHYKTSSNVRNSPNC